MWAPFFLPRTTNSAPYRAATGPGAGGALSVGAVGSPRPIHDDNSLSLQTQAGSGVLVCVQCGGALCPCQSMTFRAQNPGCQAHKA